LKPPDLRGLTPGLLLRVGVALWLLSLLTPDSRGHTVGAVWLAYAPVYGARLLVHGFAADGSWRNVAGFAANLAVFVRTGIAGRLVCLALPWLPYLAYWSAWHSGQVPRTASPGTLLYFYPWALGLTLMQGAKLWRLRLAQRPGGGSQGGPGGAGALS
jgi:hypothetical protein